MRRSVFLTSLVAVAVGVLVAFAVADALRSEGSSSVKSATATQTTPRPNAEQEAVSEPTPLQEVAGRPPSGLTQREQIEWIGNRWAVSFAAGPLRAACGYEVQPLCERFACEQVGGVKIRNCRPPTSAYRNSFFGATVQEVEIRAYRAAARFSNGEEVELFGDGGTWRIQKVGGNAGSRL